MRIAFCGASGTGKTTLATWLAEELGISFNPVGSRSTAASMGFSNPYDVDKSSLQAYQESLAHDAKEGREPSLVDAARNAFEQFIPGDETVRGLFQQKLQLAKIEWETEHDSFVSDRTTVDDFVYCALHNVGAIDEAFIERAAAHLARYDLIFFTPVDAFIKIGGDPNRVADKAYHYVFETIADGALIWWLGNDWNEKVCVLGLEGLEERRELVWQRIADHAKFERQHRKRAEAEALADVLSTAGIVVPVEHIMEWTRLQKIEASTWASKVIERLNSDRPELLPGRPTLLRDYPLS